MKEKTKKRIGIIGKVTIGIVALIITTVALFYIYIAITAHMLANTLAD